MKKISICFIVLVLAWGCKTPEARKPVSQSTNTFIKESIKRNKKRVAYEENLIQKIIREDSSHNYLTSQNGFWYYYNQKKSTPGRTPAFGDKIIFDYNILHLDGTPIYTREELATRSYVMDKENIFSGLRQGLKLMKEGETVTFLFPSHKAFGYYGDNQKIGTNVPIKSTVTLQAIYAQNDSITNSNQTLN